VVVKVRYRVTILVKPKVCRLIVRIVASHNNGERRVQYAIPSPEFCLSCHAQFAQSDRPHALDIEVGTGVRRICCTDNRHAQGLICQAVQLNMSQNTECSLARFRAADSVEQWFDLLARTIASFPQLYIVVDLEAVGSTYLHGISWLSQLSAMFQRHASRKWISRLKILLVSYGSMTRQQDDLLHFCDTVVPVRSSQTNAMFPVSLSRSLSPALGRSKPMRGTMRTRYGGRRGSHSTLVGS
jgi:hypothetical protein